MNTKAKPFIKWVGGKGQLIEQLEAKLPADFDNWDDATYIEPFVGGGAMLFYMLQQYPNIKRAVINDINSDLITCYRTVCDNVERLIPSLRDIQAEYYALPDMEAKREMFMTVRQRYNEKNLDPIENTTKFFFLNHTCFNGLYRLNKKGLFNVPYGKFVQPQICVNQRLRIMAKIKVENTEISVVSVQNEDYISLTDMAHSQMQEHIIFRWMSLKSTIEYLGEWEMLYNPNFNCTEFDTIKNAAGSNNFVLSVKAWIQRAGAIGIMAKAGRYGGTYAHRDIAYHFGMWISPRFQLLLVKEYQRLKANEQKQLSWSAKRELSKINYRIHTDAIKENLIPNEVTREQAAMKYADEADVLNIAMFGMTARQWREQNPDKKGNIRDYANINELICLSNMENLNAVFINDGMAQSERLIKLNQIAIQQMKILEDTGGRNLLK